MNKELIEVNDELALWKKVFPKWKHLSTVNMLACAREKMAMADILNEYS